MKTIYGTHARTRISGEWNQPPPTSTLDELAGRVARLVPCRRDPEAFHLEKAEIAATLRRLARKGGKHD